MLNRTIRLIATTWEGAAQSFSANILNGVARLVNCYKDDLKDELFKEKLGNVSLKEITRSARERSSGSLGYSESMRKAYNAKMQKNTLAVTKLYSGNK